MKFLRNFNNNAALVEDDESVEWVVIGKGIGFGKHPGDALDETKIERRFIATMQGNIDVDSFKDIKPQAPSLIDYDESDPFG